MQYDNLKCRPEEHCAEWDGKNDDGGDTTFHGCILTKYCDLKAQYSSTSKDLTEFKCPNYDEARKDNEEDIVGYHSPEYCNFPVKPAQCGDDEKFNDDGSYTCTKCKPYYKVTDDYKDC